MRSMVRELTAERPARFSAAETRRLMFFRWAYRHGRLNEGE